MPYYFFHFFLFLTIRKYKNNVFTNSTYQRGIIMDGTKERRKHKRVPVDIWVKEEAGDYYYFHQAIDMSVGGLFLNNKIISNETKRATYKFKLPNSDEVIKVEGEATYDVVKNKTCKKCGAGIKFLNISKEDQGAIMISKPNKQIEAQRLRMKERTPST